MPVTLERQRSDGTWTVVGRGETDSDGRMQTLTSSELDAGTYRLTFDTAIYFQQHAIEGFFPEASIVFEVRNAGEHYHVPLLLSPYGYSTYRGS